MKPLGLRGFGLAEALAEEAGSAEPLDAGSAAVSERDLQAAGLKPTSSADTSAQHTAHAPGCRRLRLEGGASML
jgi:hypothetical protein